MLFKGNRMAQPFLYAPGPLMAANSRYKYSHPAILKPSCSRYRRSRPLSVKDQIGWLDYFALKPRAGFNPEAPSFNKRRVPVELRVTIAMPSGSEPMRHTVKSGVIFVTRR